MRIDFKLILCSIILLASCQTRLSFEGRRYTKGVYWNITHSKKFKKNTTDKQHAQVHELVKPINQQASCQKLPLLIQTFEKAPISNIKTQELLNVKQRYIKKAPSYVNANTHSKAHKKLNSESKLKFVLSDGKGLMILIFFLKVLKWIFLIASPIYILLGILIFANPSDALYDPMIGLLLIVLSLLGLFISYGLHKLIKKLKNYLNTNYIPKKNSFIKGYNVLEFFSLIGASGFLTLTLTKYFKYMKWIKTINPILLEYNWLATPSGGIEPILILFLSLALLAGWLKSNKYEFTDLKFKKQQRIKTSIISGLLFLTGLFYLFFSIENGKYFYNPVYLSICGLISIVTALMPSKLLFGKNLITELKNKFK